MPSWWRFTPENVNVLKGCDLSDARQPSWRGSAGVETLPVPHRFLERPTFANSEQEQEQVKSRSNIHQPPRGDGAPAAGAAMTPADLNGTGPLDWLEASEMYPKKSGDAAWKWQSGDHGPTSPLRSAAALPGKSSKTPG